MNLRLPGSLKRLRSSVRRVILESLPKPVSERLFRRMLNIRYEPPEGLKFSLAFSMEELAGAFGLLHDNFVREGYMLPHPSGIRVTPYHFLPDTLIMIVKDGDTTAATLSIFSASPFGLPIESQFELKPLLQKFPRAVEVSSLAVRQTYSGNHGDLLFPVMKFAYLLNIRILTAQLELVGVNPKMVPLYEAIMLFRPIPGTRSRSYDFVNGAPVVPMSFDLTTSHAQFEKAYGGKAPRLNLQDYFLAAVPRSFSLPKDRSFFPRLPQNRPETLRPLMLLAPEVLKSMSSHQWQVLEERHLPNPGCAEVVRSLRSSHGRP